MNCFINADRHGALRQTQVRRYCSEHRSMSSRICSWHLRALQAAERRWLTWLPPEGWVSSPCLLDFHAFPHGASCGASAFPDLQTRSHNRQYQQPLRMSAPLHPISELPVLPLPFYPTPRPPPALALCRLLRGLLSHLSRWGEKGGSAAELVTSPTSP